MCFNDLMAGTFIEKEMRKGKGDMRHSISLIFNVFSVFFQYIFSVFSMCFQCIINVSNYSKKDKKRDKSKLISSSIKNDSICAIG